MNTRKDSKKYTGQRVGTDADRLFVLHRTWSGGRLYCIIYDQFRRSGKSDHCYFNNILQEFSHPLQVVR